MTAIELTVNGAAERLDVPSHWTLLQVLRDGLGLLGTQEGCGEGSCGSCTVLVDGRLARSCLYLGVRSAGHAVETVEGLASSDGTLHPLQRAFVDRGAVQCGFCTPGMLMTSKKLLDDNQQPTAHEIKEFLSGNFCRCGSYQQIVDAVRDAGQARQETR